MGVLSAIIVILLTLFFPPIDLLINICLTILGFIPGTIHAFYVLYVYYDRREQSRIGAPPPSRAAGIFSERVQNGGRYGYGTMR
ncbi:hypothetical protein SAPIO_CDS8926 [Scedosporium apiospermum]|uniref:Stress response RCI peptide n=1 Tax=Pseudallescheria apiosperma TaxID=563466 RepID=A0A084FXZ2_PSEDA|nr:uncharacterized protein SAPIO_CDS8926 [Scedosporium apiospermum]KEZ39954.1 hypothetical protein SAPIO_CDS8926 [Scedosporium apiospermum]